MRTSREAAVFVYKADRFLLLRRREERYWHVVAGVVEDGESYADAAARELREETGLSPAVALLDLGLRQPHDVPDGMRDEYPQGTTEIVIENFGVEAPLGWEPVLNQEHDEHRWCTLEEACSLLHWPAAREAIRALSEMPRSR